MVYVHRFLGQWLDKNQSSSKNEILRKALSLGSGIDEYLKQLEVRKRFTLAVEQGKYFYTVPKEVSIEDTRADRYYRLELKDYETLDLLLDDLKEEVAITFSCVYKPCYVLAHDFEEFKPALDLGTLYCHYTHAPGHRKPIAEVEI